MRCTHTRTHLYVAQKERVNNLTKKHAQKHRPERSAVQPRDDVVFAEIPLQKENGQEHVQEPEAYLDHKFAWVKQKGKEGEVADNAVGVCKCV